MTERFGRNFGFGRTLCMVQVKSSRFIVEGEAKILVNEYFSFEFIVTLNRRESYIEGLSICFSFTFKRCPPSVYRWKYIDENAL